jgi:hypothetical protein
VYDLVDTDMDDRVAQTQQDIEDEYEHLNQQRIQKEQQVAQQLRHNLGHHLTPAQSDFAHRMATGGASSSADMDTGGNTQTKRASADTGDGRRQGKSAATTTEMNVDSEPKSRGRSRPMKKLADAVMGSKDEGKRKDAQQPHPPRKRHSSKKPPALADVAPAPQATPEPPPPEPPAPPARPEAKAKARPVKKDTKATKTPTQLPPGKIGIQRLREVFEEAKNKGTLSSAVYLDYDALYKSWLRNRGNKEAKTKDLAQLKKLYKEHIYKV